MKDINSHINALKRPALLVRAARHGAETYHRNAHLSRYIDLDPLPGPGVALMQLFEIEKEMNAARRLKTGTYTPSNHIDVLAAIIAEAQLWRASHQPGLVFS